ncbi:MAG: glycosyltransferase family 39 protein [Phycisphaerae bacterium]|nr:glycosyltransferase family 39 protein [Phycisphaerae bacterium]
MTARLHSLSPRRADAPPAAQRRASLIGLLVVLVVATALRLPALDQFPPGLHQDEAANAWNAYCLLKTGRDQVGQSWPIFYMRALGENRSTLFAYVMLPFQALGGLNLWTTRVPAALGGILTVLLLYWTAARLFERGTGLAAAALLAVNPVHIHLSRLGHEACITPLLTLLPFASLLWAGLPLGDGNQQPRPLRALAAGLLTGACCYGYPAVRLFVPVFLTCGVLLTWRAWWELARTRRGARALAGLLLGLGVTFGPLAYMHITEPNTIGKRGRMTWIWSPDDPLSARAGKVLMRHARHFDPEFLYLSSDADEIVWTVPLGFIPWYLLPGQLLGLGLMVPRIRRSRSARVLLLGVLLFPVGDSLNWHVSMHNLRSSAGLVLLILPAAVGISRLLAFLAARRMTASVLAVSLALAGAVIPETGRFLRGYFHERPKKFPVFLLNHVDLLEACAWLKPHLDEVDAVVCTPRDVNQPYLITLVALEHDPARWQTGPRQVEQRPGTWDWYERYGKFHFPDNGERVARLLEQFRANGRADRVILFLRPTEPAPCEPSFHIPGPDGKPSLVIYDCSL